MNGDNASAREVQQRHVCFIEIGPLTKEKVALPPDVRKALPFRSTTSIVPEAVPPEAEPQIMDDA